MTNASRAYIYNDWFYICKDLMEGKINYNYNYKTPRTNYPVTQGHIPHDIIVQQNCLFAQDTFAHCSVISAHTHVWQTSPYTRMTNFTIHTYDKLHHTQVWQTSPYTGMTNFTIHTYDKLHHTQVWQTSPYTGMTNFTIHRYDKLHQTAVSTRCLFHMHINYNHFHILVLPVYGYMENKEMNEWKLRHL